MRVLLAPLRTVVTLILGVIATLIGAPAVIMIARFRATSPWIDRIARWWSRVWLIAAGCLLTVEGRQHVDTGGRGYVVVANHLSNLDIMACFLAVPLPIRFLAKKELFSIPVLAPAMRAVGIVEVDRQARSAVHEQVNAQAKAVLALGRSLIIYPEGTRSRSGELRPFKKGAFTMAIAHQVPVLPVTIHGTWQAWPPDRSLIYGGKVTVIIDPPISTMGLGRADASRLMDETRAVIEKRFQELSSVGQS